MGESTTSYIAITLAIVIWCGCCCRSASAATATTSTHTQATAELPRPIQLHWDEAEDIEDAPDERQPRSQRPTLIDIAVQASAREGLNAIAEFYGRTLPDIVRNGQLLEDNHPAALLSKFSAPDEDSERREMAGFATVLATKAFRKNYKYINELARQAHTPKISLRRTALEGLCPPRDPPTCMPASRRYRTHDGTCNSQRRPRWGAAQMPFNRFLPPEYGDGVDSIRSAVDGGTLSSSRFVSLLVHGAKEGEAGLTLMTVQWGQLLDHDLTATAQPRPINGSVPSCCGNKDFHPSCFPIKVPLDDPWLAPLKVRCLEFLRSAPAQRRDCVLSWREQTNQATSFIDASPIYSNSAKSSDNARLFRNGLLIYGRGPPETDVCQRGALESKCIRAGDGRSSEQPGLLAMHHVWVGEHNRIATQLSEINLHWSDEKIYQETRRIVGAMFQHITYREFLPVVLGREVCKLFDLQLLDSGYYEGYDPKVNPTVANSFAAAAFRFGHSLVQNSYMRCDHHHNVIGNNVSLHEEFQRGDIGSAGSLHRLLRGMASQRTLKRDEFITPELTNHLFQTPGFPFGLDLAAINIQRGRDHGVPSYTAWRVPCGLSPINTWDDMVNVVGPESARRIGHAYRSVHDVDLFVGGIAERPVVGGLVGPTFACIIAQQFSNSRKGDRFWYENGQFESSFTPAQLHAIRRVSLAQVLCRTVGGGTFQPHIFLPPDSPGNSRQPCGAGSLEPIDLSAWLEQDPLAAPPPSPTPAFAVHGEMPERVFDIMPLSPVSSDTADALTAMQVNAENKAGFPKRGHPFEGASKPQHIQFIPNSSIGFQRPQKVAAKNVTKINNKLDIKIKTGPTGRPGRPSVTVLNGISNKLDSQKQRVPANGNGGGHRQRLGSTTRRTIVVNNVPIELRSATETTTDGQDATKKPPKGDKKKKKKKNTKTNQTNANLKLEARHGADDEQHELSDDTTDSTGITDATTDVDEQDAFDIFFALTDPTTWAETSTPEATTDTDGLRMEETIPKIATDKDPLDSVVDRFEMTQDIDPLTNSPPDTDAHVRVQRKMTDIDLRDEDETESDFYRSPRASKGGHRNKAKSNSTGPTTTKVFVRNRIVNVTSGSLSSLMQGHSKRGPTKTTRVPKPTRALSSTTTDRTVEGNPSMPPTTTNPALRNIELRQFQTISGGYTRPHKVIVDGPNSDQYEIEINIRQTNKSPPSQPSANNADYTTANSVGLLPQDPYYGYDRYPVQAKPQYPTSTLQPPYYQPAPPTLSSAQLSYTQRTKPPTVIYLNDHDAQTTTRPPSFLQNLFPFGQHRPYPSAEAQKEKPSSQSTIFDSGPHQHSSHGAVSSSYLTQPIASAISQAAALLPNGGGAAHAASTAVSNGPYGSIVGVASANGADSTFSFNIRPRPQATAKPIPSGGGYDPLQAQIPNHDYHNHDYHSHHHNQHSHHHHHQAAAYYDKPSQSHAAGSSPFSTAIRNPSIPGYYSRTQAESEYDEYLGRTLQPVLTNVTSTSDLQLMEPDYPYDEYDDDNGGSGEQPEDDGILGNLFKIKTTLPTNDSCPMTDCQLDDNYVLPVLNSPLGATVTEVLIIETRTANETTTNFPDAISKSLHDDIEAEEEPGHRQKIESRTEEPIAFAPIRILTEPERPDNWINVDVSSEDVLLPVPPVVTGESSEVAAEIPKPIMGLGNIRLTKRQPAGDVAEDQTESSDFSPMAN